MIKARVYYYQKPLETEITVFHYYYYFIDSPSLISRPDDDGYISHPTRSLEWQHSLHKMCVSGQSYNLHIRNNVNYSQSMPGRLNLVCTNAQQLLISTIFQFIRPVLGTTVFSTAPTSRCFYTKVPYILATSIHVYTCAYVRYQDNFL